MVEATREILSVPKSALDLLIDEEECIQILSASYDFNNLLGGGIPTGKISEICGPPGIGKTQICLQLCANAILNYTKKVKDYDNCHYKLHQSELIHREAIYIDTEGGVVAQRLKEILINSPNFGLHFRAHLRTKSSGLDAAHPSPIHKSPTFGRKNLVACSMPSAGGTYANCAEQNEGKDNYAEQLLDQRLHYFRCKGHLELVALTILLPDYLRKHPLISLVIVDSMAIFLHSSQLKTVQRNRILATLSRNFLNVFNQLESNDGKGGSKQKREIAIVLTNQVSFGETNWEGNVMANNMHDNVTNSMSPCLGDAWGHVSHVRLLLYWLNSKRFVKLLKATYMPQNLAVAYDIDGGGIADVIG